MLNWEGIEIVWGKEEHHEAKYHRAKAREAMDVQQVAMDET